MLGKKYWLHLPCITGESLDCLSVGFLIYHWGMWWVQPLQAGPDPANSQDFKNFLTWEISRLDLFSAVFLYWRSCCSSFNQLKGKVVTSASNGFHLFLRNLEQGSVVVQTFKNWVLDWFSTDSSSGLCPCNWFDNCFGSLLGSPKNIAPCFVSED